MAEMTKKEKKAKSREYTRVWQFQISEDTSGPVHEHQIRGLAGMFNGEYRLQKLERSQKSHTTPSPVWEVAIPWDDMADGDALRAVCEVMGWKFFDTGNLVG
jgi:hypothetical protein